MLARVVAVLARSNTTVQVVVGASRLVAIIIGNWKLEVSGTSGVLCYCVRIVVVLSGNRK